ncbi:3-deoxy-D-manno-octulosonic acid kinase [Candidatus Photodesmus blepharus]|uniref:3-deoxy-D-manno-octulosonic acid kinase n=1 Tax=Candidatus Photodesmus blepharonis TaxID=1179155 RepID=A0A084CNM3_9GAMM|nr:3-deoxy-D-manno-octulosonic acid kinase [Candidatus Photodesmus blepharus]KEY91402.1 3-deoxy-D-manno-octulosonic acid kinase [Candidatus Photodesmus blepharus]
MIQKIQRNRVVIWYNDEIIKKPSFLLFSYEYWSAKNKVVGKATGRGTTWFIQLSHMQAALRHYRRGGLLSKLVRDLYVFSQWETTRSYQEFSLLNKLITLGVNVPRPIAAVAIQKGPFYQADLLCERIPNAKNLLDILQKKPIEEKLYQNIGIEIARMHNTSVNHADLNIRNILIDKQEKVWIIDFDKCCVQLTNSWKKNNLSRLKNSFIKETSKHQIYWERENFLHILKGYDDCVESNK